MGLRERGLLGKDASDENMRKRMSFTMSSSTASKEEGKTIGRNLIQAQTSNRPYQTWTTLTKSHNSSASKHIHINMWPPRPMHHLPVRASWLEMKSILDFLEWCLREGGGGRTREVIGDAPRAKSRELYYLRCLCLGHFIEEGISSGWFHDWFFLVRSWGVCCMPATSMMYAVCLIIKYVPVCSMYSLIYAPSIMYVCCILCGSWLCQDKQGEDVTESSQSITAVLVLYVSNKKNCKI